MLERCSNLEQCEVLLSSHVKHVTLLNEIPLKLDDVSQLEIYLRERITKNTYHGLNDLSKFSPISLACYLVWKGIYCYNEGEYWSSIGDSLGVTTPSWQNRLGQIFINFLEQRNLFVLRIEGAHRFLTPILFHGGIPNSCLNEFFEKVVVPLVKDILIDPTNEEEIRHELLIQREYYEERRKIEEKIKELKDGQRKITDELKHFKQTLKIFDSLIVILNLLKSEKDLYEQEKELNDQGDYELSRKIAILIRRKEILQEVSRYKKTLKENYPDFSDIELEIKHNRIVKTDLFKVIQYSEKALLETSRKLELKLEELRNYNSIFAYVDEPIKRFFIYGDEMSEKFLIASVQLAYQVLTNKAFPDKNNFSLPEKVVEVFEKWWLKNTGNKGTVSTNSFKTPYLIFDPAVFKILLHFPGQQYEFLETSPIISVEILYPQSELPELKQILRAYRRDKDLITTGVEQFEIPFPIDTFIIHLKRDDQIVAKWELEGFKPDRPFLFFNSRNQKLIDTDKNDLPQGQVWLIAPNEFTISPPQSILERGAIDVKVDNFSYSLINTNNFPNIELSSKGGTRFSIPVSGQLVETTPQLKGTKLNGAKSGGDDIYFSTPPILQIPCGRETDIHLWRFSFQSNPESYSHRSELYKLSELQSYFVNQNSTSICLDLANERFIGQKPVGKFQLHLRGPKNYREAISFLFLPCLDVQFGQKLYFPTESQIRLIRVDFQNNQDWEFKPHDLNGFHRIDSRMFELKINSGKSWIEGFLKLKIENIHHEFPLEIHIPKVKWRIFGSDRGNLIPWSDQIKEILYSDFKSDEKLFLDISIPEHLKGSGYLNLCENSVTQVINNGLLRFNISPFNDAVRSGQAVETVFLKICTDDFETDFHPILKIRTRWEIKAIQVSQKSEDEKRFLFIQWEEKVNTPTKIIRVWSLAPQINEVISKELDGSDTSIELSFNKEQLPAGKYLIHFDFDDPWTSTEIAIPNENDPNTKLIEIIGELSCAINNCGFVAKCEEEIFKHVKETHLALLFPHLDYEELAEQIGELPEKILKCPYDSFFTKNIYPNPLSQLAQHFGECHNQNVGEPLVHFGYRHITDINEIRQHYITDLPYRYKCSFPNCNKQFERFDDEVLMNHLLESHREDVIIQK